MSERKERQYVLTEVRIRKPDGTFLIYNDPRSESWERKRHAEAQAKDMNATAERVGAVGYEAVVETRTVHVTEVVTKVRKPEPWKVS